MTTVVSIQSTVAYGHVGNSAAVFPLQRLGVEVWPVPTVVFSNHTGYPTWRGPLMTAADVADVLDGMGERGILAEVDAVLCGYLGAAGIGQVVLDAVAAVKSANPAAVFCADPVMGDDDKGFYASKEIAAFWRDEVVGLADIMTPNLFELQFLTGRTTRTIDEVIAAADALRAAGPDVVLVTSVVGEGMGGDAMRMLGTTEAGSWLVETPMIGRAFTGSGDVTTALFLANWLRTGDMAASLGATASAVYSLLEATTGSGSPELRLVEAQEDLVEPRFTFTAHRLA